MKIDKSNSEWKKILAPDVYHVTREKGTEAPFTGKFDKFYNNGRYLCSNCGNMLFESGHKYDSGSGWPSFYQVSNDQSVSLQLDKGGLLSADRTEVVCQSCGAHLGHVFDDGPEPTGLRYCMNSVSLEFKPDDQKS